MKSSPTAARACRQNSTRRAAERRQRDGGRFVYRVHGKGGKSLRPPVVENLLTVAP
jgi:hypothetical protein